MYLKSQNALYHLKAVIIFLQFALWMSLPELACANSFCNSLDFNSAAKASDLSFNSEAEPSFIESAPYKLNDGSVGSISEITYLTNTEVPMIIRSTRISREPSQNMGSKKSPDLARADYLKLVSGLTDIVIQYYRNRRHWSEDYLKRLAKDAMFYADDVEYFLGFSVSQILEPLDSIGIFKVVKVTPENNLKDLPMEKELNINLPDNNGYKFEPSNFVIEKKYNKLLFAELFTRLILLAHEVRGEVDPDKFLFYTYGDKKSLRMYKTLGFEIINDIEIPIEKFNKPYWVMGISANKLSNLFLRLPEDRAQWSKEETLAIHKRILSFLTTPVQTKMINFYDINPSSYLGKNFKIPNRLSLGITRIERQLLIHLTTDSLLDSGLDVHFSIPSSMIPLTESELIVDNQRITFKNGIFKIYWSNGLQFESIELEVNADLTIIRGLTYQQGRPNEARPRKNISAKY